MAVHLLSLYIELFDGLGGGGGGGTEGWISLKVYTDKTTSFNPHTHPHYVQI